MARQIPDNPDLRHISIQEVRNQDEPPDLEEAVNRRPKINTKDIILGTISGWISGVFVTKLGRCAAFGLGGSVILLHFAHDLGYVQINWDRVMDALNRTQNRIERIHTFARRHYVFSIGYVGGFFLGMAMM